MRLIRFQIQNYKSINDSGWCELSSDNITVLAGQNESGKSNILQALRDFDYPNKINGSAIPDSDDTAIPRIECIFILEEADFIEIFKDSKLPINRSAFQALAGTEINLVKFYPDSYQLTEVSLQKIKILALPTIEPSELEKIQQQIDILENQKQTINKELKSISQVKAEIEQVYAQTQTQENKTHLEETAAKIAEMQTNISKIEHQLNLLKQEHLNKTEFLNSPDRVDTAIEEYFSMEFPKHLPDFIYFDSFNDRLPKKIHLTDIGNDSITGIEAVKNFITLSNLDMEKIQTEDDDKRLDNYLKTLSTTVSGNFLGYWSQFVDGRNQANITVELKRDDQGRYLVFFVNDGNVKRYPEQRSQGFLWFLSFYLRLTAITKTKKDVRPQVILIDEPGSYLHAKAQKDILKLFETELCMKNQIIYSTHSSELISPYQLNRVRLVFNTFEVGTKVTKINHCKTKGESVIEAAMLPIIQAIGQDVSANAFLKYHNVILEGISDYYYLSAFAKRVSLPETVAFIPCTGASTINKMVSILIGWQQDFIVILDADPAGNKEARVLISKLDLPQEKIIRIPNGAIEDLFSPLDFSTHVLNDLEIASKSNGPNSELLKSNILSKEVLARRFYEKCSTSSLDFEEYTLDNFNSIFRQIRTYFNISNETTNKIKSQTVVRNSRA